MADNKAVAAVIRSRQMISQAEVSVLIANSARAPKLAAAAGNGAAKYASSKPVTSAAIIKVKLSMLRSPQSPKVFGRVIWFDNQFDARFDTKKVDMTLCS